MSIQSEPVFGGSYGDSGTGKTADLLYAFPDAEILAPKGSLKEINGIVNLHGIKPKVHTVITLDDSIARLKWWLQQKTRPPAIGVDDVSLQQQAQLMLVKSKNFETWRLVLEKILEIAMLSRKLDCHLWMTFHEAQPGTYAGEFVKGGPLLAGSARKHLPKSMDVLLRVQPEEKRPMWPFVYQCNNCDINYLSKDRTNTCADHVPMNTGEILRMAGYTVPRGKGLEWQEPLVQKICDALLKLSDDDTEKRKAVLVSAVRQLEAKSISDSHIAWVLRDAVDRSVLKRTSNNPKNRMLNTFK